ncbi:MAG TPA: hypothetical protein VFX48_06440, partial [Saprospiraceae bacterium]|nr:hypothetical protein [Saprospiraceae bacterium]
MKVNITLVVILLFGLDLGAQSLNQYKNQISKYLSEEDHYGAYMTIQEALKFETQTDSFQFLAGMSAWHLNAYSRAAKHFKSIISLPISERHPEIDFYLGESLFMQGFYSEALIYFKSCLASTSPESEWHAKSGKRIASAQWAKENVKKKNPLIQSKRLDDQINTAENEFSPFISDSVLYITSGNVFEKTKKGGVPRNSGKIMKYNENTLQLSEAEPGLNEEGVHMAHPCLSPDGQVLFFTVCEYLEGKSVLSCDLYYKRKSTAGWGPKVRLPDPVNRANSSSTQPSAAIDPESKLLKLYFSSNRPGGKGGFDLYAVLLNDELEPSQAE